MVAGWTLQELIAPKDIKIFTKDWQLMGTKDSMLDEIAAVSKIDYSVLKGAHPATCSIAQRMA